MNDLKDKSIHRTTEKLAEDIKNMKVYETFYNDLQVSLSCVSESFSLVNAGIVILSEVGLLVECAKRRFQIVTFGVHETIRDGDGIEKHGFPLDQIP